MPKYFCKNCFNFKTRTITSEHLPAISKYKIKKAIKEGSAPSLGLAFPFNLTAYNRVTKLGECKIFYCTENRLERDLYIDRGNAAEISCGTEPCPKYEPVHIKS
jgi:hypothetical protein